MDAFTFYSVYSLREYGVPERLALSVTLAMGIGKLVFAAITMTVVDTNGIGRRIPLMLGAVGCFLAMFVVSMATYQSYSELTGNPLPPNLKCI